MNGKNTILIMVKRVIEDGFPCLKEVEIVQYSHATVLFHVRTRFPNELRNPLFLAMILALSQLT